MDDRSITPSARGVVAPPDARLLKLIQFVDEAIVGRSDDGVATVWNAAAEQLFGYSSAEMIGQSTARLFAADTEESLFSRINRGEAITNHPAQCLTKDGRAITALLTVLSATSVGHPSLIIAVDAMALSQKKDAQHFLAAIVESADDAVMSKTLDGIVTSWNRAAEKMFGYSAEEMIGAPITKIFPPDAVPEEALILERLRRGERIDHYETKRQRKDGRIVDVSLTVSPIRDGKGRLIGASKVARDITLRKQMEGREREALQQAQALNRAKDEFIATISHELRTPMTAILGWIRMLKLGDLKPEAEAKAIAVIERNAKAQARLIEDLLDASRIISGKLKLNIRQMDLAAVIDAVIDALRPACQAKHITIETFVEPESGVMVGDPERMQQVVWNLVSNAIKFTSKAGRVEIQLLQQDSRIHLTVSDTGAGIGPEFLPYVFNRFSQADSSLTRTHGGLGMGLSIVKSIVELHGGVVAASSEGVGKGATFSVDLPLIATPPPEAPLLRKGASGSNEVDTELSGLKILVVDDEADTCEMLRHLLERCGAVVCTATSAAEALLFLQVARVDLLISDISMPTVDGYELIRRVRAEGNQNAKIPAVALTALARIEDRVKALAAGYQMHIAKPVEPSELVTIVASAASLGNKWIQ